MVAGNENLNDNEWSMNYWGSYAYILCQESAIQQLTDTCLSKKKFF